MFLNKNKEACFDLKQLEMYIKECMKKYNDSLDTKEIEQTFLYDDITEIISNIILQIHIKDNDFLEKNGFRLETDKDIIKCIYSIEKKSKVQGKGGFGTVYDVKIPFCLKNIPKHLKRVAIKIENIRPVSFNIKQLSKGIDITKYISKKKIAPELYDSFFIINKKKEVKLIKIFEFIDGVSFKYKKWKTEFEKKEAMEEIKRIVKIINKVGIIHSDLHNDNVLITKDNKIYIIDFDLSKWIKNYNTNISEWWLGKKKSYFTNKTISTNMINYMYNECVQKYININKLKIYIKEFVNNYTALHHSTSVNNSTHSTKKDSSVFSKYIKKIIMKLIFYILLIDPSFLKKNGLHLETDKRIVEYFSSIEKKSNIEVSNVYGNVYNVDVPSYLKNIPKNVKKISVKIENIQDNLQYIENLRSFTMEKDICKYISDKGISPLFYDFFFIIDENGKLKWIKIYEYVEGELYTKKQWKSPLEKEKINKKIKKIAKKINQIGIIHGNINSKNVFITKKNKIYIVDFKNAMFAENYEQNRVSSFNINWDNYTYTIDRDIVSEKMIDYVYNNVIKNKIIIL